MPIIKSLAASIVLLAFAGAALAQQASDVVIAPFVDSQTIVVVRADTSDVKASSLLDWILSGVGQQNVPAPMVDALRRAWQPTAGRLDQMLDGLAKAKVNRIYWIGRLSDFLSPQGPQGLWVAPLDDGGQAQAVGDLLLKGITTSNGKPMLHARQVGSVVVASEDGREAGAKASNALNADWVEALKGETPIRVALVPGDELRRSLEENAPNIPSPTGAIAMTTFTRGIKWVGVSMKLPPGASVSMVAKASDAASAQAAGDAVTKLLGELREQNFPMRGLRPSSQDLAQILKPTVAGDELRWSPDIVTVVKPMLVRSATSAARARSAGNIKQVLLGIVLYANNHKMEYPPDLATMEAEQKLSPGVLIDPLDPEQRLGFIYVRPSAPWRSGMGDVPILYEEFAGGNNVGFADGHVEWFGTRQQVEELFKQPRPAK
jgi:prepilin-type processing-associated H-X9-DG protein